ncbi:putative G-protein coupled receptor 160 [Pelodytes ibericus]
MDETLLHVAKCKLQKHQKEEKPIGKLCYKMANSNIFIRPLSGENLSDLYVMNGHELIQPKAQLFEPSCILILIITGKIIMNIFIIHYFQDFAIWGIRFTNYHICLLTQILSHVYGILHYPVFLASGLDYYLTIVRSINLPRICAGILYIAAVLLLWIVAFLHVLRSPVTSSEWESRQTSYECTFYISKQSFYLSAALLVTIFIVLAICFFEIVAFMKSMKVTSYMNKKVILFSYAHEWPIRGLKFFLTTLLFSFLVTWAPFVILQVILLSLCASIPGYMDLNVPWLYFINSFLVGLFYSLKYPNLHLTKTALSVDPFIEWKFSVLPFIDTEPKPKGTDSGLKEMSPEVII